MKKLVALVFFVMMSVSSFANVELPTSKKEVKKEIRTKIVKLLGNVNFKVEKEVKTTVDFLINRKGEIVILDIDCVNPLICDYIKSRLNYKKVYNKLNKAVKVYKMPLRIVNPVKQ